MNLFEYLIITLHIYIYILLLVNLNCFEPMSILFCLTFYGNEQLIENIHVINDKYLCIVL